MRDVSTGRVTPWLVVPAALLVSSVALALPWDTDMADQQPVKAYEQVMAPPVEGTVAQPNLLTPEPQVQNWLRGSPEGQALTSPYPADDAQLALGQHMFQIYCTPCHGVDGEHLGPVAAPGRLPGVVPLAGPAGVAHLRTDGWIYLTIRNGGAVMPTYGWAMSDREMWSVVAYVRTLANAAAPAPAQENAP
jgi:mono/diheme cytochrome c family protein